MQIEVRLFATFRNGRWKNKFIDFEYGTTIKNVLDFLDIKESTLGIALINGKHSNIDTSLNDGDILSLFPPVGGG